MRCFFVVLAFLLLTVPSSVRAQSCASGGEHLDGAAFVNALSYGDMVWTPFDQVETGWATYLPLINREIGTDCGPGSPGFAAALAQWQLRYVLNANGIFDMAAFQVLKGVLQERRPFVMARVGNVCPDPPPIRELGYLVADEEHANRLTRLLRRDTLDAYRRMVLAARQEVPEVAADPERLQIFSGFRDPEVDAARCATSGNCDGLRRAVCSPHRTGTAVDLYVGQAPGRGVDSTAPDSRLYLSQTATYRWLVINAGRFGFVPYLYEPWHWEYIGGGL